MSKTNSKINFRCFKKVVKKPTSEDSWGSENYENELQTNQVLIASLKRTLAARRKVFEECCNDEEKGKLQCRELRISKNAL